MTADTLDCTDLVQAVRMLRAAGFSLEGSTRLAMAADQAGYHPVTFVRRYLELFEWIRSTQRSVEA